MKIREITYNDDKRIRELLLELTEGRSPRFRISELLSDPNCICLVAEDEGRVVGFGAAIIYRTPVEGVISRMEDLVVDSEVRGQGYGRALAEELLRRAKQAGAGKMDLTSSVKRQAARELYRSLGFREISTAVFSLDF